MGGDLSERQESPLEIMDPGVGGRGGGQSGSLFHPSSILSIFDVSLN